MKVLQNSLNSNLITSWLLWLIISEIQTFLEVADMIALLKKELILQ